MATADEHSGDREALEQAALDLVRRIVREGVIDLREAAVLLGPSKRGGAPRTVDCVRRYITAGSGGVRLEGFYSPAGWRTSAAAVERFVARLHLAQLGTQEQGGEERRNRAEHAEAAAQAKAELEKLRRELGKGKKGRTGRTGRDAKET